ncbi:Retrovirus-related Pol polyprotein from transposon 17.6 [Dictyocoela muelleri]|nr:Retrovirus-related Pol polyprotein from transposon 17.6 [Dictyocoela muelleri]
MNKTYVFKKMPFGLCNAPSTFQRAINYIFRNCDNVLIYMDDILLYSKILDEHKELLEKVFRILTSYNVSVNFEKSTFARDEIEFLGHKIYKFGIRPNISKLESYANFIPKTKKPLQRLLGFINWFRPFIKNLSILTASLYEKLKGKGSKIIWSQSDNNITKKLFSLINNCHTLHHPDINKEFTLRCDASDAGIGAILLQDGKLIGYFSKKYKTQEKTILQPRKKFLLF